MKKKTPTPVLRRRFDFDRPRVPLAGWILVLVLVVAFVEVWQVTRVSALTMSTEKTARLLEDTEARRDYLEGRLAVTRTRSALEARARALGMKPAEPSQIVVVPAAYLAGGDGADERDESFAALGRMFAESLVPSARAKGRVSSY